MPATNNADILRACFLHADTWQLHKDGAPLYLLDTLKAELQLIANRK